MSSETMKTAAEAAAADYKTDALERLEDRCRLILRGDCDNAAALGLLGVVAHKQGRNNLAVRLFERTIKIDAQAPQFHNNLGVALKALGNLEQAVDAYRKAVLLKPDYAEAYNNLGSALQLQGKFAEAVENYRQAVLLRPDWAETYNDMAVALSKQGSYRQAVESSARALQIKSDYPEAYNTMASALHMQAKFHEAVRSYRKAILLRPDYAEAHTNLGITLLLNAEFAEGWRQYAWRRYAGSITYPHHYQVPQWDGSSFIGKRLLVHYEQGLGDNIQFIRYLPTGRCSDFCRVSMESMSLSRPLMIQNPMLSSTFVYLCWTFRGYSEPHYRLFPLMCRTCMPTRQRCSFGVTDLDRKVSKSQLSGPAGRRTKMTLTVPVCLRTFRRWHGFQACCCTLCRKALPPGRSAICRTKSQ